MNILIIAYDWPPRSSIASHRPYAWAKYWSQAGACVSVLTSKKCEFDKPLDLKLPNLNDVEVIEVEYGGALFRISENSPNTEAKQKNRLKSSSIRFLKKFKHFITRKLGVNIDIRDEWAKKSEIVVSKLIESKKIDVVVSTYGPRACHIIGGNAKVKFPNIFWVADYRDPWSQNHLANLSDRQRINEEKLEKKLIQHADLITTVSDDWAESLSRLHETKVEVISNGFDFSSDEVKHNFELRSHRNISRPLKIVYTGMIYPGRRDPAPLFDAIRQLLQENLIENNSIEVHFYGERQPGLENIINDFGAENYSFLHGHVSREISLLVQSEADLLLLLESGSQDAKGVLTGKVYEYIASGVPILSLGSGKDSAIGCLINKCGVGFVCGNDIIAIKNVLKHLLEGSSPLNLHPDLNNILSLSRESQSIDFFNMISKLRN